VTIILAVLRRLDQLSGQRHHNKKLKPEKAQQKPATR